MSSVSDTPVPLESLNVGQYFVFATDFGPRNHAPRYQVKSIEEDSVRCELCWVGSVHLFIKDALVCRVPSSHPCLDVK